MLDLNLISSSSSKREIAFHSFHSTSIFSSELSGTSFIGSHAWPIPFLKKVVLKLILDLERRDLGLDSTLAPEGTAFEHAALAFLDGVVAELAVSLHKDEESLLSEHNQGL